MAARTTLFSQLQKFIYQAWLVEKARHPELPSHSRRRFLKRSGAWSALALSAPLISACGGGSSHSSAPRDPNQPRIAIIGGGLAGLTCAYTLEKQGIFSDLYESSGRTGGRTWSARGKFSDNQLVELGGEFIDSGHSNIRALAAELGLTLVDVKAAYPGAQEDTYFIDGQALEEAEIVAAFRPLAARMARLVSASDESDGLFTQLDNTSIHAWLDAQTDISPVLRKLLDVAYLEEYGLETTRQSLFNLLYFIDYENPDPFHIFGDSDERFHIAEGNDSIAKRLSDALQGEIFRNHSLTAANLEGDGSYRLTFNGDRDVQYDHVVFALPFTLLRQVSLGGLALPDLKLQIINELGYGTNSKLMLGFGARVWRDEFRSSGAMIGNNGLQTTWDTSRGQEGTHGVITNFVGGDRGIEFANAEARDLAEQVLPLIDQLWPGTSTSYDGHAVRMGWPTHPHTLGSYACYLPGQARWSGLEGERVENLHFCGEHTSIDNQGFMEGACESGLRVASEIISDLAASIDQSTLPAKSVGA